MPNLSKSRFVSGAQCEKKLFFDLNRKDLKPPVSSQKQALFDTLSSKEDYISQVRAYLNSGKMYNVQL